MEQLSPLGPVYQAGTLSGNPVAMAAGIATLRRLLADGGAAYRELERLGARLQAGLQAAARRRRHRLVGGAAGLDPLAVPPAGRAAAPLRARRSRRGGPLRPRCTRALLERGVYLAPSAYEVLFVSLAHDDAVIDQTTAAFGHAVSAARD